ncbi:MAG: single-stranded DNA-binding protein [Candidatus Binatus sp.]|uniref:single-stranded DNA-binding protein n=1 Tax=Candidatus Binatus sp. TaxID=2811406 RepID=UPI0027272CC4|nr:single-stranded DNA-binding protein [Candidatus Binatus sp.]MDO8434875.1 single-stranded DNA-binding protein [Candidatus Binatus sp.]
MKSAVRKVTGNRIELDGPIVSSIDFSVTPRGTAVLRMIVDCGAPEEDLKLAVVLAGERASVLRTILAPGHKVKVRGRLRSVKAGVKALRVGGTFEVLAESIEPLEH